MAKGRNIRYLGRRGGGLEFLLLANFFFTSERKQSFLFWRSTSDNFLFYVSSKNFFVVRFPYYVRYHLVFFLVNIFFINFDEISNGASLSVLRHFVLLYVHEYVGRYIYLVYNL